MKVRLAKKYYTFMIDPELAAALKTVKRRDGISEGDQIRQALSAWMEKRGVLVQPVISANKRRALVEFTEGLMAAPGAQIMDIVVPRVLGRQLGGGKRFGNLMKRELERLGELTQRIGEEQLAHGRLLASRIKRMK